MRAVLFLLVLNALLLTCLSTLPPLKTQQIATKRGYALHTPERLENTRYLVRSLPTAPVSLYKYPYNSISNYVTAPNINYNVIPQNNYVKNFYDEDENLMSLKLFYDRLAKKMNKQLVRKSKIPTPNYELVDRNIHRTSFVQNPSYIQKYIINKGYSPNFIGSRRAEPDNPITKFGNNEKTHELNEDGINNYKKGMYLISDPERSNVESESLTNLISESSEDYNNLEPLNIHEVSVRRNETSNLIDQYYFNEDSSHDTLEVSDAVLNNDEYHVPDLNDSLRRSFTLQPAFGLMNSIKGLLNKMLPQTHNNMKIKTDLTHYSLNNLHMPQNDNSELQLIKTYLTKLMRDENYKNPIIIQILHDANKLDLSKLDLLDQSQLVKLSETDLQYLKKYFVMILNKYGITQYTLKLLEYINRIEGKPKKEIYLLFKILTNPQAMNNLSPVELSQIKQFLQQILNEFGQNPYISPFNIKKINIDPINNNNILFLDVNNHATSIYVSQEDMRQIYLYLLQSYKNNPFVLKIIQNVKEIYENPNREMVIPVLNISSYLSLANLNQNDLDLLVKYILQIIKQRGENSYLNRLLFYINRIRDSLNNIPHENEKELSNILQILRPFTNIKPNGDETRGSVNLSADDLAKIKNILLQIKNKNKANPILIDILQFLNEAEKQQKKHFDLQPIVLDVSKNTIDMNVHDMEQIYKYLQNMIYGKDNSDIVKILQLIKQTQNQNSSKDKNGIVKIKYNDLVQLYNYLLQSQKEDTGNPIFIKILQYINQNKDNVLNTNNNTIPIITLNDSDKIFSNEINLDEIYKFILNKYETDKSNLLLSDIIQHINKTLVLPNGQLKIKILTLNNTQSQENLNPKDLEIIYSDLHKLKENKELITELLQYIVNNKNVKKYESKLNVLSYATRDALDRIKNFLLTLMKEQGEIPYVIQILLDINRVEGIPESTTNQHLFVINDTVTKVNEDDLQILSTYLTKIISEAGKRPDLLKILNYVYEAQNKIKKEKESQNKQNPSDLYILQIIKNSAVSPEVVDILRYINSDNWNSHFKKIDNLKEDDLNVLSKYLQQISTQFGASSHIKEILDYINKINEKAKHKNDDSIIYFNNTYLNVKDIQNQKPIKITRENLNMINKHFFDLLKRYGMNCRVLRTLYVINHITEIPNKKINTLELIFNSNKNDAVIKFEDFKVLNSYLIQLINKHGANSHLLKILGDINQVYGGPINDINTSIINVNNTHIVAIVDSSDINRIKSNLRELLNYYGLKPYIKKILNNINSNNNNPNVYTFIRLNQNYLNQFTQCLLQLMEKHGANPNLVEILKFIYQIYVDFNKETKPEDTKEQYILEITKEINILLKHGVTQYIQNTDRDILNTLYKNVLQNIFISPNTFRNNDIPSILTRLIVSYKQEVFPVNKYILLKLYEYLLKNGGVPLETFWQPGFINVLLNLNDSEQNKVRPYTIHNDSAKEYFVIQPYYYDIKILDQSQQN